MRMAGVMGLVVIGHENAHARMSAILAIISAIFTKLLQLKWSETDNCTDRELIDHL